jgi:hypothetical protein
MPKFVFRNRPIETAIEVKNKQQLIGIINQSLQQMLPGYYLDDIKIEDCEFDSESPFWPNWNIHLVSIQYPDGKWWVDGYLSDNLEDQ